VIDISVIVPTYNRRESLRRLLTALASQTHPAEQFEVLVIDDGSTDGTRDLLATIQLPFALHAIEQAHQGPAEARNLGVEKARAPLVLFLDDDVVPASNLIAVHLATHTAEGEMAVVIGPMSPPREWKRSAWVRWEEEKLQSQYDAMQAGLWTATERQFYTANSSLSRALFMRVGGFDSTFKRAEDVELGYRLRDTGARFVFTKAADVLHYASRSFEGWCRIPYQYGRYDVVMTRDKGHEALLRSLHEFHGRHILNRWLSQLVIGRPMLLKPTVALLEVLARAGNSVSLGRLTSHGLSAIFNLLYWQGVCDELGGRSTLDRSMAVGRPVLQNESPRAA
jgi:GT2 family glycosyltransferase